jgi:inosine/xanthosine triphosphate pyrophosphatase family protein
VLTGHAFQTCLDPDRTFAELQAQEKSQVSHRGRAMRALLDRLPAELRG